MKILKLGQMLGGSNAPSAGFENLYSLEFDGSNYVQFLDKDVFTINDSGANRGMTWSAWIKPDAANKDILTKDDGVGTEWKLKVGKGSRIEINIFGNDSAGISQNLVTDVVNIITSGWHHVAVTFDLSSATSSLIAYVDGVPYSQALGNALHTSVGTWSASINTNAKMVLAASSYVGHIDEVAIFDNTANGSVIDSIYNSGVPNDISGLDNLLGWWRNGDPTGTGAYPTIVDQSTNSNDGTMTNMASGDIQTDVP
tara:strand:- start:3572 stop:4336 length:765 start_codon:yes stop_codon:yes gene_type:complete